MDPVAVRTCCGLAVLYMLTKFSSGTSRIEPMSMPVLWYAIQTAYAESGMRASSRFQV